MASLIDIFIKYQSLFLKAVVLTVGLSMGTVLVSTVLGSLVAFMKLSKNVVIKSISSAYVAFIRGTPLLVQIYMVYYGLPLLGVVFPSFDFLGADFSLFMSGLIALIINSTAYVCEIVRGGIQSVDDGQMEAARSIGFNKFQAMLHIVFPQAFKNVLPSLGNEFVSIIKESSQVSVIGLAELMYTTTTIRSISYKAFEPLIIVSVIYFIITYLISFLVQKMEKKLAVSNRS